MFHGWENYFVLIGTASGGLIGLLFVVVTLTSNFEREHALRGSAIYMTPTMAHFAIALTVSAIVLAPGLPTWLAAVLIGGAGAAGMGYALRTALGVAELRRSDNPPHWTDLWCYAVLPAAIYAALEVAAVGVFEGVRWAPFWIAALVLASVLTAIRNAWDLITWITPRGSIQPK